MRACPYLLLLFLSFGFLNLQAEETYMYRLYLKNKGTSPFSVENPGEFLSEKSIQRRNKQGYSINETDLPYDPSYFESIRQTGANIQTYSKWVNTIVVHISDLSLTEDLKRLNFVDSLHCVWKGDLPSLRNDKNEESEIGLNQLVKEGDDDDDMNNYAASYTQISLNNGHLLHNLGFYGSGLSIAVLDGGFENARAIGFFDQSRIKEVRNFNHETTDPLASGSDHGTMVLSCMLANKPGEYIGTAPLADYYLFRTEATGSEFPVEEDYWIAALEYADSLGVDIVTTSLGYSTFDDPEMNHTHSQLDGKTIPASRAASMAASKGLLLLNSAGNEGNKAWEKIMVPADADSILTVGSVTGTGHISEFSSKGYTADGRVKPDVLAMGSDVSLIGRSGQIRTGRGTSFSTPIMAGLTACLWEALPQLTNLEIMQLLRETANQWNNPDISRGYGIANVFSAYEIGNNGSSLNFVTSPNQIRFDSQNSFLYLNLDANTANSVSVLTVYSLSGNPVIQVRSFIEPIDLSSLPQGVYIVCLQLDQQRIAKKIVKL